MEPSGDQRQLEVDPAADRFIQTNFADAAVAWCLAASAILEQRSGALIVIGL